MAAEFLPKIGAVYAAKGVEMRCCPEAKALLAKAGYPNGFELSLWAMPVQRPYNPNAKLMAEMVQTLFLLAQETTQQAAALAMTRLAAKMATIF